MLSEVKKKIETLPRELAALDIQNIQDPETVTKGRYLLLPGTFVFKHRQDFTEMEKTYLENRG